MLASFRYPILLAVALLTGPTAYAQTLITTTTTYDAQVVSLPTGTLSVNGSGTPTLFLLNGSTLTSGITSLTIGNTQTGALHLAGGSTLTNSGASYLGRSSGATGTGNIQGLGTHWDMSDRLEVGSSGIGSLVISDGATVANLTGIVGGAAAGVGTVTITGANSTWTTTNTVFIGNSGQGTLLVADGGSVISQTGILGYNADGNGVATLTGSGSSWTANDRLYVGLYGTGTLNVADGATVTSQTGLVGATPDGQGTANVFGTDSTWSVGIHEFYVGNSGTGALNLTNGGRAIGNAGTLGGNASGFGTAVISGPGSQWTLTTDLKVGNFGQGNLTILNGGTATSGTGFLAFSGGSQGTASISGANSQWTLTNDLYVGGSSFVAGGTAALSVTDGGALDVGGKLKLWNAGTLTIGTGGSVTARSFDKSVGTLAFNDGTLTISGGTYTHAAGSGTAANMLTSNGNTPSAVPTLQFTGGATAVAAEATVVGSTGRAQLFISGGSVVTNTGTSINLGTVGSYFVDRGDAYLGLSAGSTGTAVISGVGSKWTIADRLNVGFHGTGSLRVEAGGTLDSYSGFIGVFGTSLNTATITGTGSKWTTTNAVNVGTYGVGQLNIEAGGAVVSSAGYVGNHPSAIGTAVVSGGGSQWTMTGSLFLASSGSGTLNVLNGGKVANHSVYVASSTSGVGTALVSGLGSLWTATNFYVGGSSSGSGGAGSITVTDGGALTVANLTKIYGNGSLHVGNGGTFTTKTLSVDPGGSFIVDVGGSVTGTISGAAADILNGTLHGNYVVQTGGTLGGSGVIVGRLSGAGTVGPGNSPGVLDAVQIDPTSGIDFLFEFTAANTLPDYLNRMASINDVLHLTHATTPFTSALSPDNTITVDFQVGGLTDGDFFYGGFFTDDELVDFFGNGTTSGATYSYLLNGQALNLDQWNVSISTVAQPGTDFGIDYGGTVDGRVMQFQVTAVPEPGSLLLVGSVAGGYWLRRRRKATSEPRT